MVGGAIAITKHGQHKAVLISQSEFDALTKARSASLDELTKEFDDALLRRMQTPASRKGMSAAFNATPAQLGKYFLPYTDTIVKTWNGGYVVIAP